MRTTTAAIAAVLLLATLTSCSDDGGDDAKPEPAAATPETGATSAAPEPVKPLAIGDAYTWTDETETGITGSSTVLSYEHDVKTAVSASEEIGSEGYVWSALELKVCSTEGTFSVSNMPWVLAYEDGARVEPSGTTYEDFPRPEFPHEATVTAGKCVRGKVVYAVPGDVRPESVIYSPASLSLPIEWAVPAK
ncbi:DUF4352 domain-containing protein [Streptomyces sp. NBC_01511]|uniref:hypothetical protein n=1 Tax=Streptomyces sp. NBC_01511 TaxID=2903889 RepID=UPI003867DA4F